MKPAENEPKTSVLVEVAKAVGKATGTVASLMGTHHAAPESTEPRRARGKMVKKNKSRVPRRLKKTMKKQALAASRQ
jgi:alkaline phosphatase